MTRISDGGLFEKPRSAIGESAIAGVSQTSLQQSEQKKKGEREISARKLLPLF